MAGKNDFVAIIVNILGVMMNQNGVYWSWLVLCTERDWQKISMESSTQSGT